MNTTWIKTSQAFEDYCRFTDGLILSFEYFYAPNAPLAVQMVFHARNYSLPGNVWRRVQVIVKDVKEVFVNVKGNQFNSISSGVKLLYFEGSWCIDVDGNYALDADPTTLDEVRRDGDCYVIGREVEVFELS